MRLLVRSTASAASSRSLRVLVAEDDALNAAMLRAILEQLGHQVVGANNGRRALELAQLADFEPGASAVSLRTTILVVVCVRFPYVGSPNDYDEAFMHTVYKDGQAPRR